MEITAQTYQLVSLIGFILAAVFCVTAVVIWFRLGIRKVIGELSGRTQRKRIEQMRKDNEDSGGKILRPLSAAMEGGKIRNPLEADCSLQKSDRTGTVPQDDVLQEPAEEQTSLLHTETELMDQAETQAVAFHMIQDIVIIHTGEAI